jgi:hypothetical protein
MTDNIKVRVSKLDAARRQLDCAIDLWFRDRDAVAVHTLAAASHQIIHDIHAVKSPYEELIFDSVIIKDEHRKDFINLIKGPVNFFKHADKDPDAVTEFNTFGSITFMLFSIVGLAHLGERSSDIEDAFVVWMGLHYPAWLKEGHLKTLAQTIPIDQLDQIRNLPKRQFLELFLTGRAANRAAGLPG